MRQPRHRIQPYLIEDVAMTLEEVRRVRGDLGKQGDAPETLLARRL